MQPPIGTLINICNYTQQDIKTACELQFQIR